MIAHDIKYFTPAEARRTLPLVRKIVKDIIYSGSEIKHISESLGGYDENHPEVKTLIKQIAYFMEELREIGCYYKDWNFSLGLVDFPAIIEGKEVYLCWRSDENEITFYHEMEEGYTGRKLIPVEYFEEE